MSKINLYKRTNILLKVLGFSGIGLFIINFWLCWSTPGSMLSPTWKSIWLPSLLGFVFYLLMTVFCLLLKKCFLFIILIVLIFSIPQDLIVLFSNTAHIVYSFYQPKLLSLLELLVFILSIIGLFVWKNEKLSQNISFHK